jgi:predicted HicB family RNase H-like nuclease
MAKSKILNLRIEPDLKKEAKKLAEQEGRSVSNWVTWLIQREVKANKKNAKSD